MNKSEIKRDDTVLYHTSCIPNRLQIGQFQCSLDELNVMTGNKPTLKNRLINFATDQINSKNTYKDLGKRYLIKVLNY